MKAEQRYALPSAFKEVVDTYEKKPIFTGVFTFYHFFLRDSADHWTEPAQPGVISGAQHHGLRSLP